MPQILSSFAGNVTASFVMVACCDKVQNKKETTVPGRGLRHMAVVVGCAEAVEQACKVDLCRALKPQASSR